MVVTRETHATEAGLKILESGGNAVDAAVAVGFALAVTYSYAGNIGGGGFMLVRMADGRTTFIDFRERAPLAASRNMYLDADGKATQDSMVGYRASGVPGTVRGMEYASQEVRRRSLGGTGAARRWTWRRKASRFPMPQANSLQECGAARSASSRNRSASFCADGKFYEPGDTFVQPDLGRTLERIARLGANDFYEGETARLLAKDMQEHGGLITLQDLKEYAAIERKPLTGKYRGLRHHHFAAAQFRRRRHSADARRAGRHGLRKRRRGIGQRGPLHDGSHAPLLRRPRRASGRSGFREGAAQLPAGPRLTSASCARPSIRNAPRRRRRCTRRCSPGTNPNETTHYTVADAEGNIATVTYTLNGGYGSKVTATGLGFLLNNEMDDFAAQPGPRQYVRPDSGRSRTPFSRARRRSLRWSRRS